MITVWRRRVEAPLTDRVINCEWITESIERARGKRGTLIINPDYLEERYKWKSERKHLMKWVEEGEIMRIIVDSFRNKL